MATGILPLCFKSKFPSWCFCHCLFLIGNFFMVDSPRFPKSSGIDAKEALIITYVSVSMLYVVDKKVDDVCD